MKRQKKEGWKVILRLRVVGRWKGKGMRKAGESAIIKKKEMLKKIIGKLERKIIMTWMLMWLNVSTVILNATFQLLVIYRWEGSLKERVPKNVLLGRTSCFSTWDFSCLYILIDLYYTTFYWSHWFYKFKRASHTLTLTSKGLGFKSGSITI